jgi:hypothetical protein
VGNGRFDWNIFQISPINVLQKVEKRFNILDLKIKEFSKEG